MDRHDHPNHTEPALKQAELREAAHEGPHGSHADARKSAAEAHDPAEVPPWAPSS